MIEELFEPVHVKAIADVLLIDLAEELVILEPAEPTNPAIALFRTI